MTLFEIIDFLIEFRNCLILQSAKFQMEIVQIMQNVISFGRCADSAAYICVLSAVSKVTMKCIICGAAKTIILFLFSMSPINSSNNLIYALRMEQFYFVSFCGCNQSFFSLAPLNRTHLMEFISSQHVFRLLFMMMLTKKKYIEVKHQRPTTLQIDW